MPEPLDFDKVRWKLADQMLPEEVDLIIANKDKLNDEEKAAFADLLDAAEPLADDPKDVLDNAINDAVDDPANAEPPAGDPPAPQSAAPVTPEKPVVTLDPTNIVTTADLETYLEEKKKQWDAEGKSKADQKTEAEKITTMFDSGYTPKDWNEFGVQYLEKISPLIESRVLAKLEAQNKTIEENRSKMQQTQREIYQRFETEFATLATSKLIPDPKAQPEEYKKVHEQILAIGDAHGKSNVTDAYKLWAIIPVEHGGGLVGAGKAPVDPKLAEKARIDAQKIAAGKIGSGRGGVAPVKKGATRSWAEVHGQSMEDLIESRLQQP
jgi:hypothetical protein